MKLKQKNQKQNKTKNTENPKQKTLERLFLTNAAGVPCFNHRKSASIPTKGDGGLERRPTWTTCYPTPAPISSLI